MGRIVPKAYCRHSTTRSTSLWNLALIASAVWAESWPQKTWNNNKKNNKHANNNKDSAFQAESLNIVAKQQWQDSAEYMSSFDHLKPFDVLF